jgi:electron transfer flavoprotein beta subunit
MPALEKKCLATLSSALNPSYCPPPRELPCERPDNSALNPFDRPAIEAALQLKESTEGGQVTALSMGPAVALEALSEALAMGADRAVLVSDRALAESDTLVTARVLAKAVKRLGAFDFIVFGTRTSDSDTGQVGPQTAALLDIPFISRVTSFSFENSQVERQAVDGHVGRGVGIPIPAAVTIDSRAFKPRSLGLDSISAVYDRSAIEQWTLKEVGIDASAVGLAGSPTRVASLAVIKRNRNCRMLDGDPREQADALIEHLKREGLIG